MKNPTRNKFEMAAHDIQFKQQRPSWEHTVETYTGNNTNKYYSIGLSIGAILGLILVALIVL